MPETNARIKVCHDTAANFKTNNPTLLVGEWALETDTKKMKIGDGTTAYNSLPYSTAEDSDEWQKPDDWIDIRSGALPNSVYYLVGHSADYTTFPAFDVYAQISNSGTYDIYIDGVKKYSAVASGTLTTLTWQTLALETGYNTTYPQALRTHIVRVTPTLSTNTITWIGNNTNQTNTGGVLWVHFTTNNYLQIRYVLQYASLAEAVTCNGDSLLVGNMYSAFAGATSLKEVPTFDGNNGSVSLRSVCQNCSSLKKVSFKNLNSDSGVYSFSGCSSLKKIVCDNAFSSIANNTFYGCEKLEKLPSLDASSTTTTQNMLTDCSSLQNTLLDMQPATGLTRIAIGGTSSARIDGLKGLLVSNSAPFDGSSPQIDVKYTGLDRGALVNLFNSMPYNVGYTVVGSPTITDGVMTSSSPDNYVRVLQWNQSNPFELHTKITTGTFAGDSTYLITSNGFILSWHWDKKLHFAFRTIASTQPFASGQTVLSNNTTYWIKIVYDGTTASLYLSTNGTDYNLEGSTEITPIGTYDIKLGETRSVSVISGTSIDLGNTYININGIPWFRGTATMTKTCDVRNCTGTADLTAADKAIAEDKGWAITLS